MVAPLAVAWVTGFVDRTPVPKKGKQFFLKKRTRKLVFPEVRAAGKYRGSGSKSFLLLFFKKAGLAFLATSQSQDRTRGIG